MIKVLLKHFNLPNFKLKEIIKLIKVSRSFTLTHHELQYNIGLYYCMNIGEYCPEQNIILHKLARDNIHQYSCNNPFTL